MATTEKRWLKHVFRVEGLPNSISNCQEAARFIAQCLGKEGQEASVRVCSVATTLNYWESPPSKVATVQFNETVWPSAKAKAKNDERWEAGDIRLDTNFLGMTPLNDVESSEHKIDCIAISGLASHPFGSWQPRGEDKSFMWIRDELPMAVPGARAIIYGYDSKLSNSKSFQTTHDIAIKFFQHIRSCFPGAPPRPLVFLAHSLGGIVLKDVITQMANAPNNSDNVVLEKMQGAIMFGVPNFGMDQSHLAALIKDQPNQALVQDLSCNSRYLEELNKAFSGIAIQRQLIIDWVYETEESETVVRTGESLTRNGPTTISVNRFSATNQFTNQEACSSFPINTNHSDMVKFYKGHPDCMVVLGRLREICGIAPCPPSNDGPSSSPRQNPPETKQLSRRRIFTSGSGSAESYLSRLPKEEVLEAREKIYQEVLESLDAPSLDSRQTDIDPVFKDTFDWALGLSHFTEWLQDGTGIFWINGKPGSGKSTLMKYIFEHRSTRELTHSWERGAKQIFAGFFFHFRGTAIQKSFEGVLRSLLGQILKEEPTLLDELLSSIIVNESHMPSEPLTVRPQWSVFDLEDRLRCILSQKRRELDFVLFFDALDEFDGHLEVICRFLKELVKQPDQSKTRIKVCFSSRPWETFVTHFDDCPKITIQDHTQDDIRNYYLGNVPNEPNLVKMAPEVVRRASGVFLWVRLLIRELTDPPTIEQQSDSSPSEDIQMRFDSFPDELDQFYELTINRIPSRHRWKTFVLLEAMIRAKSSDHMSLRFLYRTVIISQCQTSTEAHEKAANTEAGCSDEDIWKSFHLWSGGLVEKEGTEDKIKMMHQTVYDFVRSIRFKELVLGPVAKTTHENGYSFLAKQMWASDKIKLLDLQSTGFYMKRAESTTGRSLLSFYEFKKTKYLCFRTESMFAFANLILCLRELIEKDSSFLKKTPQPLLLMLFLGEYCFKDADIVTMVKLLQDHGYPMRRDIPTIVAVSTDSSAQVTYLLRKNPLRNNYDLRCKSFLDKIDPILFNNTNGLEMDFFRRSYFRQYSYLPRHIRRNLMRPAELPEVFYPLHISGPATTEALLRLGCHPNTPDTEKMSPLDWAFEGRLFHFYEKPIIQASFEKCCILVRADSVALSLSSKKIQQRLDKFDEAGCDTAFLREKVQDILQNGSMKRHWGPLNRLAKRLRGMLKIIVGNKVLQNEDLDFLDVLDFPIGYI